MSGTNYIPKGMTTVTPHLIIAGAAEALDFYVRALGAVEESRLAMPDGTLGHAQMRIGGSAIMLAEEVPSWGIVGPKTLKGSAVNIHLYVEDVEAFIARAVKAGAKVTMPIADMFWGDRFGKIEDPYGHQWSIATHVRDVSATEMEQAMRNMPKEPA